MPLLALLALLFASLSAAQQGELKEAGVCSRCHVVSVLEWQTSAHPAAGVVCTACHGPSLAHVANERNEVSPDRLPRGPAADGLCQSCHTAGCPSTSSTSGCVSCHNQHSLTSSEQIESFQGDPSTHPIQAEIARLAEFRAAFDRGEALVAERRWSEAKAAFEAALKARPEAPSALARIRFCERRLNPEIPGFDIIGDEFDPVSGLPRRVRVTGLDIEMLLAPAGELDIGSDALEDSRPAHTVVIEPFYLSVHEITQAQWEAVTGERPSATVGPNHPVERVSWQDAQDYVGRLNARVAGAGFRLPTEAEWEYAARAGGGAFDAAAVRRAWFRETSSGAPEPGPDDHRRLEAFSTHPVGTKEPNVWGFFDMQGNVWEWTSSLFRPYVYDPSDGREDLTTGGDRVLRGGGYADPVFLLDPALRHPERPNRRYRWNGLRLARSAP